MEAPSLWALVFLLLSLWTIAPFDLYFLTLMSSAPVFSGPVNIHVLAVLPITSVCFGLNNVPKFLCVSLNERVRVSMPMSNPKHGSVGYGLPISRDRRLLFGSMLSCQPLTILVNMISSDAYFTDDPLFFWCAISTLSFSLSHFNLMTCFVYYHRRGALVYW